LEIRLKRLAKLCGGELQVGLQKFHLDIQHMKRAQKEARWDGNLDA